MAGFKFKLQSILKLRENVEKEKKNEFGAATQRIEREKLKLEQLNAEMYNVNNGIEKSTSEGATVGQLLLQQKFKEYYKGSILNQKVRVKMAEEHLEDCRHQLVKAVQDKKMMEKLKDIDHEKYLYTEQKNEEKLVDDLVSFKKGSKQREG
jgi:flagellar FliJ protein